MTLIQSTLLWRLLIKLIRVVQECTWIELATCWPFMAEKAAQEPASFKEVAIEASQAVSELPMWMGYTARWKVRCISLAEANEILAGCKRLEKENRRREHLHFQERLASMHQFTNLSANAIPFQPQAALPTPRLAGAPGGLQE